MGCEKKTIDVNYDQELETKDFVRVISAVVYMLRSRVCGDSYDYSLPPRFLLLLCDAKLQLLASPTTFTAPFDGGSPIKTTEERVSIGLNDARNTKGVRPRTRTSGNSGCVFCAFLR